MTAPAVATPIRGRLLKPKVVRRWARQSSYSLTLRELAREYRKAPSVGGLRIGSSFFRTYTVEHSRKGAPVVNIKRGLMRLWIFASIGWVAFVGGTRAHSLMGGAHPANRHTWHWMDARVVREGLPPTDQVTGAHQTRRRGGVIPRPFHFNAATACELRAPQPGQIIGHRHRD
jgi:hypothetical protein